MTAASAIPDLIQAMSDDDPGVKCAVIRALGELRARSALNDILLCLADDDPEVRIVSLIAIPQIIDSADQNLLSKIEGLLQHSVIEVQMHAALALARLGLKDRAVSVLVDQLRSSQFEHCLLAVQMFEELGRLKGQFSMDIRPLIETLEHPAGAVRKAVCQTLGYFGNEAAGRHLIRCLGDTDSSVRQAAARSLWSLGSSCQSLLMETLKWEDIRAQEAALDAMTLNSIEARNALLDFVHRDVTRVYLLRQQLNGLIDDGRSIKLLREALQDRIASLEKQLVKIVGIFSDSHSIELVRKSLYGRDGETRAAALEALETLGDKELTHQIIPLLENEPQPVPGNRLFPLSDVLEDLLSDSDDWARALTVRVISEMDFRRFISKLHELKASGQPLTSEAAQEALIQFGEEKSMDTLQTISTFERILLLREVPIFADLSPEDLKQIADVASERWLPDGADLCRAGDEGSALYIIVSGKVRVLKDVDGVERDLAVRGEGDFVGEMAIIESAPRMATLRALGELRVLVIDGLAFNVILRDRPEVSISVMKTLSRRLRERV